jgi:CubicO group peptidase (beta-lactamase class C family)
MVKYMRLLIPIFVCVVPALLGAEFQPAEVDPAAAGMSAERIARIPKRMQEFVDAGKAAGIVTLVARHGHVALLSAAGYQDLEKRTPMRTDTMFRIMSMTKPMTATAVMMLVDEGRLAVIDPVRKYLPEFRGQKLKVKCPDAAGGADCLANPSREITIADVLAHTSGIQERRKGPRTLAESVAATAGLPLEFEPGTAWRYRTAGTNAAGRIVEVVSGEPYERFMAERLFAPLGMRHTTFFPSDAEAGRIAAVYTAEDGALKRVPMDVPKASGTFAEPGAGAFSTAGDLARFYQMVLNGGVLNGKRILSAAAVQLMTSVQTGSLDAGFAPGQGYGFAWEVVKEPKGSFRLSSVGSFGHGGAYRTYGWVDPAKDMFSVILMQRTNGGDVDDETNAFLAMAAAAIEH